MGNGKTNRYAFVAYPESLPFETLLQSLRATHTKAMISPIHDKDLWDVAGLYNRCQDIWRVEPDAKLVIGYSVQYDGISELETIEAFRDDYETFGHIMQGCERAFSSRRDLRVLDLMSQHVTELDRDAIPQDEKQYITDEKGRYVLVPVYIHFVGRDGDIRTLPVPGDRKKEHYHVLVKFDYSLTADNALRKLGLDGLVGYLERVNSEAGYIRYLCHLDDPDKYEYDRADVITLGGYDQDPLYYQDAYDQDQANTEIYKIAQVFKASGSSYTDLLDHVYSNCDWKARKAFRSNQAMWRNYLSQPMPRA